MIFSRVRKQTKEETFEEEKVKETKREEPLPNEKGKFSSRLYSVLKAPRVTEKATLLAQNNNTYAFEVLQGASKGSIKNAVEKLYNVNVERVRVAYNPPKKRRLGKHEGFRAGFKKAYVQIGKDQKIDFGA